MLLTRAAADQLVQLPKVVGEPILWKPIAGCAKRFQFGVDVYSASADTRLELKGRLGPKHWSYVLLGPHNARLRRISTPRAPHPNPDGTEVSPHHKHIWSEDYEDREVYIPDDIHWEDYNQALRDFVQECNITLLHPYSDFYVQARLMR